MTHFWNVTHFKNQMWHISEIKCDTFLKSNVTHFKIKCDKFQKSNVTHSRNQMWHISEIKCDTFLKSNVAYFRNQMWHISEMCHICQPSKRKFVTYVNGTATSLSHNTKCDKSENKSSRACSMETHWRSQNNELFSHCLIFTDPLTSLLSAALRSNAADYVLRQFIYLLSAALRSNAADYVLPLFIFIFFIFFIHRSFSETTGPIHTKFSGIVYSSADWIIR